MIHEEPPLVGSTSQLARSAGCVHEEIQHKLFFHMDMTNYPRSGVLCSLVSTIGSTIFGQTDILRCQIKPASKFEDAKCAQSDVTCSSDIANYSHPHVGVTTPMLLLANCADCLDRTSSAELGNGSAGFCHQLHVWALLAVPDIGIEAQVATPAH